ncbi:MAG TPA: hypothetical protein VN635_07490 [Conexibacter sp.]|nr:hypothetical protein [Conexibacter sp.]
MRSTTRLLVSIACALGALAAASGAAAASTMFFEPAGAIEAASSSVTFEFEGTNVTCSMLLRGRLNSSVTMREGERVASISSVTSSACSGGTITWLAGIEWPWKQLLGTPESPRGFLVYFTPLAFLVETLLFRCLYEIRGGMLMTLSEGPGHIVVRIDYLQRQEILRSTQLGFVGCPRGIVASGSFTLRPEQSTHIV